MNNLMFIWPEPEEQEHIVNRASTVTSRIRKEQELVRKLQTEKAGLMHDLLTGKVQVNPDPPEATHV